MKKYSCSIKEFRDVTQPGNNVIEYRMKIEAIPVEKRNQPDEKQYRKTYEIIISLHKEMKLCWHARGQITSDNDIAKVICVEGRDYFEKEFESGNLPESSTVNLYTKYVTPNGVQDCRYDPDEIQCYQVLTFEVARKIGFR